MAINLARTGLRPAGLKKPGWGRIGKWASVAAMGAMLSACNRSEKVENVACTFDGRLKKMETSAKISGREILVFYDFDVYGLPKSAMISDGKRRIAEARVEKSADSSPTAFDIELAETHYDADGAVSYQGKLVFRAPKIGMGVNDLGQGLSQRIKVEGIKGSRQLDLFQQWPGVTPPPASCAGSGMF